MEAPAIITVTLNPTFDRIIDVPGLTIGAHARGRLRSRLPAGKAINVSRALAKLGLKSVATGWVGRDDLAVFEGAMRQAGIEPAFVPIGEKSRENITLIDPKNRVETHIRDEGPSVTAGDVDRLQAELDRRLSDDTIVVFTGSACGGFGSNDFGRMIDACSSLNARVVVDASGHLLREAVRHDLWLIKPNREELEELAERPLGSEKDLLNEAFALGKNCRHVVVTLGAEGALAVSGQSRLRGCLPFDAGGIRSTVGCGDAFLAGYLHGLRLTHEGDDAAAALRYGLTLGTLSAMSDQPADFDAEQVDQYASRVTIEE